MVHDGPGRCWDSHGRSEVAEGDYIAPTVLIQGWLVSGPGSSSALLLGRIDARPESESG